ncbi:ComEC/Rec2 family competence protein [Marinomonas sp.]|uniref:ComEC/Rec2 family competence protein n=1 Tax=Marinomonas sp. TaxID=1904862 RepID=UPI003A8DDC87
MSFTTKILQAEHGDCILIQGDFEDGISRNILVDGGTINTYRRANRSGALKSELVKIKSQGNKIDLLILTHIDDDHIAGILAGFKQNELLNELTQEVWFNSGKLIFAHFGKQPDNSNFVRTSPNTDNDSNLTSISQGVTFESILENKAIWHQELILEGQEIERFGATFSILSPTEGKLRKLLVKWKKETSSNLTSASDTDYSKSFVELLENDEFKEDKSIHNGSSIAFIFEYQSQRIMLLGDAHDHVVVDTLKQFFAKGVTNQFDFVKLSHHGSQYNTSSEFLNLVECENFVVSTNSAKHGLPNKLTLARIYQAKHNATIHFNYPELVIPKIFNNPQEKIDLEAQGFKLSDQGAFFNYG